MAGTGTSRKAVPERLAPLSIKAGALRLRGLVYGCAVTAIRATVAFGLVAGLDFTYRVPGLHVALETTAAIAASAAAFLFLGRFWRTGFLGELILSAGVS